MNPANQQTKKQRQALRAAQLPDSDSLSLKAADGNMKSVNEIAPGEKISEHDIKLLSEMHQSRKDKSNAKQKSDGRKDGEEKWRQDLIDAIEHFEGQKHSWANTLCYPELFMARIPFLCPVPTAVARMTNVFTLTLNPSGTVDGNIFWFSFCPEIMFEGPSTVAKPFAYNVNSTANDQSGVLTNERTREQLFPAFSFSNVSNGRIVGASIKISQSQPQVNRAGYGACSRVYGYNADGLAMEVSKTAVLSSVYQDQANYTNGETLRMVYAPGDFSDLHMSNQHVQSGNNDRSSFPNLMGFIEGINLGGNAVQLTLEFTAVVEYVPKPTHYQMVERKPAVVDPKATAHAENMVSALTDYSITKGKEISGALANQSASALYRAGSNLATSARDSLINVQRSPIEYVGGAIKGLISDAGSIQPEALPFLPFLAPKGQKMLSPANELTLSSRPLNNDDDEVNQATKDAAISQYIADAKFVMRKQAK